MKTEEFPAEVAEEEVKTNPLGFPYICLVRKKYWYFRWKEVSIPMGEEYGSDAFRGRLYQLMQIYGLDYPDDRHVYFIGWKNGPVKIGVAGNIRVRLNTLQVACPYDLDVIARTTGGVPVEREYHRRFAKYRLRNEWFERCTEIEAEINRITAEV